MNVCLFSNYTAHTHLFEHYGNASKGGGFRGKPFVIQRNPGNALALFRIGPLVLLRAQCIALIHGVGRHRDFLGEPVLSNCEVSFLPKEISDAPAGVRTSDLSVRRRAS